MKFTDVDGVEQSLIVTTGSQVMFVDQYGDEHGGAVLWPEESSKLVKTAPTEVLATEDGGDGLAAAAPEPKSTLSLHRFVNVGLKD